MVYSSERKLALSGWLLKENPSVYWNQLKMQKFLFFYECFCKADGEPAEFTHLHGYKRGPVFTNVWGDYTKEQAEFSEKSRTAYAKNNTLLNPTRTARSSFLVSVLNEKELLDLSHAYNVWSCKKDRIMGGERQVSLDESDFSEKDILMTRELERMFPNEMLNESVPIHVGEITYVFKEIDIPRLTAEHLDALSLLLETEELHNPVYVEIDDEGRVLIN